MSHHSSSDYVQLRTKIVPDESTALKDLIDVLKSDGLPKLVEPRSS